MVTLTMDKIFFYVIFLFFFVNIDKQNIDSVFRNLKNILATNIDSIFFEI